MSAIQAFIDRFEGEMAVLLISDGSHRVVLPREMLPEEAVEGSVLKLTFEVDPDATKAAKRRVQDIIDRLSGE